MKRNDENLQNRVAAVLAESYGLVAKEISFIPVGEESFAYKIVADHEQAYFVKYCQVPHILKRLHNVHELLLQIRDQDFVVPPVTTPDRQTEDGRVYVFPYVEGPVLAMPNEIMGKELVVRITDIMSQIHKLAGKVTASLPVETFDREYWEPLKGLKDQIRGADPALSSMFGKYEVIIEKVIRKQEAEAKYYQQQKVDLVVTHGDITGRNMIQTTAGLKLVDWDEAMFAPAEKDLIFFHDNPNFSLDRYYEYMGKDMSLFDPRLMGYYGRQWVIESLLENFGKLAAGVPDEHKQEYLEEIDEYIGYCKL
jgi:thiamine kinase-like enzyme